MIALAVAVALAATPPSLPRQIDCLAPPPLTPLEGLSRGNRWQTRLLARYADVRVQRPSVVMLGDSITAMLGTKLTPTADYRPIWDQYYAPLNALNLGDPGATTANLAWQLRNGALDGYSPDVVVILIGANDRHCGWPAEYTAEAIVKIAAAVREKVPIANILVEGVLPRENDAWSKSVNAELGRRLVEIPHVRFHDLHETLMTGQHITAGLFREPPERALHPSVAGAERIARAVSPLISRLKTEAQNRR